MKDAKGKKWSCDASTAEAKQFQTLCCLQEASLALKAGESEEQRALRLARNIYVASTAARRVPCKP